MPCLECPGQGRYTVYIVQDDHSFLGNYRAEWSRLLDGQGEGGRRSWQTGHLAGCHLQAASLLKGINRSPAVGNNQSNLVQDQVEKWFHLEGRSDAFGDFEN